MKALEVLTFIRLLLLIVSTILLSILLPAVPTISSRILHDHRVIGMSLDVFLKILRPFKSLPTEVASVRLQRYMDTNV